MEIQGLAENSILVESGFALIIIGIVLVMLAILLILIRSAKKGKGEIKGAGAVIIGPIPVVFGNDQRLLKTVLLLSIVLSVLLIVMTVVQYLLLR